MGIGGGSGGGGFKLEKTWRATGVGTTTFNSPGNFTIPFGKYEVLVSGRAGTGNPNTPGTVSGYNPTIPSTISGSNPPTPSTISGSNPVTPGNPTGVFNAGSGGNFAGYTQSGGNLASYNAGTGGGFNVTEFVRRFDTYREGASSNNPTGTYNPPSGGNSAGYNPNVPGSTNYNTVITGNQNFNPLTPGGFATIYTTYVCEPAGAPQFIGFYVDVDVYNSFYQFTDSSVIYSPNCPAPSTNYQTIPPSGGNATGNYNPSSGGNVASSNPPSGGNQNFNPVVNGNQNWNAFSAGTPTTYTLEFYFNNGFQTSCPAPYTLYEDNSPAGGYYVSTYETVNFSCTPVPGSPGTANFNAVTNTPTFNPFVSGNQNFNSATGGNPNYNAAVSGNLNYNAVGGQNANFNSPLAGVAGASTNVLGVFFPGGNVGAVAPFVSPTRINRYIADDTTYPVNVPTGAYVTIQSR